MSLKDVYSCLVDAETARAAAEDPQVKLAMQRALEWDEVGRQMARRDFAALLKEAGAQPPPGGRDDAGALSASRQALERIKRNPRVSALAKKLL